jgi:hypothetical protein
MVEAPAADDWAAERSQNPGQGYHHPLQWRRNNMKNVIQTGVLENGYTCDCGHLQRKMMMNRWIPTYFFDLAPWHSL